MCVSYFLSFSLDSKDIQLCCHKPLLLCNEKCFRVVRIKEKEKRSIIYLIIWFFYSIFLTHNLFFFSRHQSTVHIQSGRNIRHLPCVVRRSGIEGVCMFAIDCIKANGTHLGTCIDRFYFGSCCQLKVTASFFCIFCIYELNYMVLFP